MTRRFAAFVFITAWSASAAAQTARPSMALTLEDAIARGLAGSHRVAELMARREGVAAQLEQRRADARPQIVASGGYTRTNHVDEFGIQLPNNIFRVIYPDLPDNVRSRVEGQWTVYNSGRFDRLQNATRLEGLATDQDLDALRQDLTLEITRAYWNLVVATESLAVVDDALKSTSGHLRDVRNQLDAGLVPPNDVFTAEAREARQRMLSVRATTARANAEADLARLIFADEGQAITPMSALTFPAVDAQIAALVARAKADRAERKALQLRIESNESRKAAAAAALRPAVGVVAGADLANPNPRIFPRKREWATSWDASVNVTWPLFDGGRTRAAVAEATAMTHALEARLRELDSVMSLEIRQRVADIESTRAAVDAADAGIRAATEAERVVGERFAAGVATSTDVLDAQSAVLQARFDRTDALASARFAEARLKRALGRSTSPTAER
jgi:outer membrane protein TolC